MERVTAIINSMHYIHVKVEVYMHVKKKKTRKKSVGVKKGEHQSGTCMEWRVEIRWVQHNRLWGQ